LFSSSYQTTQISESVRTLTCLEAMKTWDNILIYVISNKMYPESKQLWARRIALVEEMLITFLEEGQFESENFSQRISKTHIKQQQQQIISKDPNFST
jgi:hypothetical protein